MSLAREYSRSLAYELCERREVPLLVTDMIAEYLVHRDLFNISILSRSLNAQANAIIYRNVVVDLDGSDQSNKEASLLFRTLLTSETAAQAVRTLCLIGDPLQDWRNRFSRIEDGESIEDPLRGRAPPGMHADLTDFTQEELELYEKAAASSSASKCTPTSKVSVWALYLHVFRLTPHIQDFSISSDYFRFPDFCRTLQHVARDSSTETLRSCSLCMDLLHGKRRHASVVKIWDSALLALFAMPGIQSIAAVVSLKPESIRQLRPGGSAIRRLILHHYQIQDSDLNSLLAATPNLRYLKYHAMTDYAWHNAARYMGMAPKRSVGLEPLYDALHHVSDSLQELHTSQVFDEDSIHFGQGYVLEHEAFSRQRGQLSNMKRLHTLTIPYASLLGWTRKSHVWDWAKILPSSLRRIVLNDNLQEYCYVDDWQDEDLMPVISSLVEWLSALREGAEVTEFGLHLAHLSHEFIEPVRQELTRMCTERGVQCLIEKKHADRPKVPRTQVLRARGRGNLTRGRGRGRCM